MSKTNCSCYPETADRTDHMLLLRQQGKSARPFIFPQYPGASCPGHPFLVPGEQCNKNLPACIVSTSVTRTVCETNRTQQARVDQPHDHTNMS